MTSTTNQPQENADEMRDSRSSAGTSPPLEVRAEYQQNLRGDDDEPAENCTDDG